ncbi:germination protein YpeB [Effusibacillus lacus]|uniref:Germination protein YpeB n=1 Tax=Effusibacillus lacus TaxID=1348429 RepID=A0A292YLB7_9BACL|nr:germination protein YpeB [Effusibacillus lacus]TCS75260.1 spore germination protein [Effusibacillus lacus]GAX89699.1 germination protein YpeB [Effusibacillus lacus]
MVRRLLAIAAVLALVVTGFWGFREHQQKQALLLKAENQYQRAFHDLSSNLDLLQDELGKALAMNTQRQLTPCLSNIWRISYLAQSDLGQLPLSLMPFNRTQEFLKDIGEFSYRVAIRDQRKEPLTDGEWKTLQTLYNESIDIEQDIQKLQTDVLQKNLRWMDAELALSQTHKKTDNQIVDGFKAVEKKVSEFPELQSQTLSAIKSKNRPNINNVSGDEISQEEAARKAANFLGKADTTGITVQKNGKGTLYPAFSITVQEANGQKHFMEMTVKGGHVTWTVKDREVKDPTMDLVAAQQKGEQWLSARGFSNLSLIKTEQYDNTAIYTFVPKQDGVLIYPDTVTVKVALDNGEVIGFNGQDYLFHHKQRSLQQPKLTQDQARKFVSKHTEVQEAGLALVEDEMGKEVLTYEFIGTMDNDTYRIYINADNGDEEKVEKLKQV